MSWKLKQQQEYEYLYMPEFDSTGMVVHGITTRSCGDMSPAGGKDNYQHMASTLFQSDPSTIFVCRQIHGNNIYKPEKRCVYPPEADALITNRKGITLSIFTADCLPIFILDPENGAIGLVHAGWRGTMSRIVQRTMEEMGKAYQTNPSSCLAGIGPGICGKCYEVGLPVVEYMLAEFKGFTHFLQQKGRRHSGKGSISINGKNLLNLSSLNKQQMLEAGVLEKNISVCEYCTAENNSLLYSYRMEGENAGRMMSVLSLR
ncbi:MAG: peptidoglycan editing factor PgeF [Candidatus Desantisbacteria bacterium]